MSIYGERSRLVDSELVGGTMSVERGGTPLSDTMFIGGRSSSSHFINLFNNTRLLSKSGPTAVY